MFDPVTKEDGCVEMEVFDDDGPEGYFNRLYFKSSWDAVNYAVTIYDHLYHFRITQYENRLG